MSEWLAAGFLLLGGVLLVVAAWGVVALPDVLARQHAATKAGTLALALVCVGAMWAVGESEWLWRLGAVLALLLVTLPVASNLLARAALAEQGQRVEPAPPAGDTLPRPRA